MLAELTRRVRMLAESPVAWEDEGVDYLCLPGSEEGGAATFLAFGRGREPLYVAKVHRSPAAEDRAQAEARLLRYLAGRPFPLSVVVPRLLMLERVGRHWVLVQSVVPGRPLAVRVGRNGRPRCSHARRRFAYALHALEVLADASPDCRLPDVKALFAEAREVLDLSLPEQAAVDWLEGEAPEHGMLPARIRHGDFTRHNLLVSEGNSGKPTVGVIDWTEGMLASLPLHDLFFFVTTFYLQRRRTMGQAGFLEAFATTFVESNPYQSMVAQVIESHARTTGVPRHAIPWLFGMFLVDRAVTERKESMRSRQPPFWRWFLHAAAAERPHLAVMSRS